VAYALAQVGKPYRFGTAGPATFDCSGLTLAAYRTVGISLAHLSSAQARAGRRVDWRRQPMRPGDLVFVPSGSPRRPYGHVGMAVSASEWVVAPRTGTLVRRGPIPRDRITEVRRLLDG
jgi:cell wall-associated NlpC family hydrolase